MAFRPKTIRPMILAALSILIILEIVVLTPSPTEDLKAQSASRGSQTLIIQDHEPSAIPNLPKRKVAEYGINSFKYVSTQNGVKQWKLDAATAFMYDPEKLVHGRTITAYLYDPDEKVTLVTGAEAKYFMNQRDLEIYGSVHTQFADGFEIWSEYLRYKPGDRLATVPSTYSVRGVGHQDGGQQLEFSSLGFHYEMSTGKVLLPKNAKVTMVRTSQLDTQGVPNKTLIESDQCLMHRDTQIAFFTMNPNRALSTHFVQITQPTLYTRGRRAELNYGDFSNVLKYLVAHDEVLIKESGSDSDSLRYATGGLAEFDTRNDRVTLSQFPQVYQDEDTVTGDLVIFHRNTGIIEIEQSNGFSHGQDHKMKSPADSN